MMIQQIKCSKFKTAREKCAQASGEFDPITNRCEIKYQNDEMSTLNIKTAKEQCQANDGTWIPGKCSNDVNYINDLTDGSVENPKTAREKCEHDHIKE